MSEIAGDGILDDGGVTQRSLLAKLLARQTLDNEVVVGVRALPGIAGRRHGTGIEMRDHQGLLSAGATAARSLFR